MAAPPPAAPSSVLPPSATPPAATSSPAIPHAEAKPAAKDCRKIDSLTKLPQPVQKLMGVRERGILGLGVADRGQDFNSTDVIHGDLPSRRLNRACMDDRRVIVLLDVGGFAMHRVLETFVKQQGIWREDHSVVMWGGSALSASERALVKTVNDAWRRPPRSPPPSG